jgi:hypothetical protein
MSADILPRRARFNRGDPLEVNKIYVLVKNFAWTNDDVELFKTSTEAEQAFKKYTGFAYSDNYFDQDNEEYNEKFSETKIFEIKLPYFLDFKKAIED